MDADAYCHQRILFMRATGSWSEFRKYSSPDCVADRLLAAIKSSTSKASHRSVPPAQSQSPPLLMEFRIIDFPPELARLFRDRLWQPSVDCQRICRGTPPW